MSKTVTSPDRIAMLDALWLASNITYVCTSIPQCQAPSSLRETVGGWLRRVEAVFRQHDVFQGSWEGNVLSQAMDAYDRWRLDPADSTFDYSMSQLPTQTRAELARGEAEAKLAAVRSAMMVYRRAYNGTKTALYRAFHEVALTQEGLYRELSLAYGQPEEPAGLTGPGPGGSDG